ncbi:MAG: M18 family aminopeptidase [Simkaniaceae bacterium]
MDKAIVTQDLLSFIHEGATPWHAAEHIAARLIEKGFQELQEQEVWNLEAGKSYFIVREGAVVAWRNPHQKPLSAKILGAHTDSPCLKVKPNPESLDHDMTFLLVEPYGSPILTSWLNRDLYLAGRILFEDGSGNFKEKLLKLEENPLIIPSVALHLDRSLNEKSYALDKQKHLAPLADIEGSPYLLPLLQEKASGRAILDFDLMLVPKEAPNLVGRHKQLIASHRIDNLAGVHSALHALLYSGPAKDTLHMAAFYNAEEIGSKTYDGADGPILQDALKRICLANQLREEEYFGLKSRSLMISVDAAHGYHPSFQEKYDPNHVPLLGKGPVFKYSAQQRYTTTARSAALLIDLCRKHHLPFQKFVTHSNIPAGSTIGPISASKLGISSVDIGIAELSMHSVREIMAAEDQAIMCKLLTAFFGDQGHG